MATIPKQRLSVAHTQSGGQPYVRHYPEAASQSFKKGDFVVLSSGKVTACASDPATILGLADQDATGTTDTPIRVILANEENIFSGNLGVSQTTAVTNVGTAYGTVIASGLTHVNSADTTGPTVMVVGLDPRDQVGDTNGRVLFKVVVGARQLG